MEHPMTSKTAVTEFLAQRALAIAGASRDGKKFGSAALRSLKAKGYRIYPIHPSAASIEGEQCYRSFQELPEPVGGVVMVLRPEETEKMVKEAADAGITRVWMQTGAESATAIDYCTSHGMSVIHGECILMFAEPAETFHRFHRTLRGLFGRLPR
jgi:predicted CoA-binding protein